MASNTYELIHIFTDIYHKDWQTGPLQRGWLYAMAVFCLLSSLVDAACILLAYSAIDAMIRYGEAGDKLRYMRITWALVVVDWCIEIIVGFCLAIKKRGQVSALLSISVTNVLFTVVQYGALPIAAYSTLLQIPGFDQAGIMNNNPAVRGFVYLSLIQGISYGLSTYTMVIWCKKDHLRGGNLFLSVLGIPYACKMQAYMKRDKIRSNWAIILVRSIVYVFVVVILLVTASLLFAYLTGAAYLERVNFYIMFAFVILASLPFLVACAILLLLCCCHTSS